MMKQLVLFLAAGMLLLGGCNKQPEPGGGGDSGGGGGEVAVSVEGSWELTSVATKASVGSVNVSVYITFGSGQFTLYQKIGEGRYTQFTGTYTLVKNTLSGKYSTDKAWGPYTVSGSGTSLTLTTAGGKEADTYKKIGSIPSSVLENLY